MRDYELLYIVPPQADQERLAEVIEGVKALVEANQGKVHKAEPWGLRRLAYPIKDYREGQYVLMHIALNPQRVSALERSLRLNESIIRHLIVRMDEVESS